MADKDKRKRDEIYANPVRAGKRTYFFDVKSTRADEYFITITESKRRFNDDGKFYYEKHKIFLYREDFDKFLDGLTDVMDYVKREQPLTPREQEQMEEEKTAPKTEQAESNHEPKAEEKGEAAKTAEKPDAVKSFSDVNFEDLGSDNKEA